MTKQEYEAKYMANTKLSGFGFDTTQHLPCPFCAEPDFASYRILEVEQEMQKEHICKACGRGIKAIFERDANGVRFHFVQTCGDDPPDYVAGIPRA